MQSVSQSVARSQSNEKGGALRILPMFRHIDATIAVGLELSFHQAGCLKYR